MKKSIIALMGLFTLVACSEDSYQEADKMNEDGTVENTEPQNSIRTIDSNTGYSSPFDEVISQGNVNYHFDNNTNFTIELVPHVGMAYFDGADDGFVNIYGYPYVLDIRGYGFENIYANSTEYLNLLQGTTIIFPPMGSEVLNSFHCPVHAGYHSFCFDIMANGASSQEAGLLAAIGKLYYLDFVVKDPLGAIVVSGTLDMQFVDDTYTTPSSNFFTWNYLGTITPTVDEFYYESSSKEIITGNSSPGSVSSVDFRYGTQDYNISLKSDAVGVYFLVQ